MSVKHCHIPYKYVVVVQINRKKNMLNSEINMVQNGEKTDMEELL